MPTTKFNISSNSKFIYIALFIFYSLPLRSAEYVSSNKNIDRVSVVTEYLEPYQIKNVDGSLGGFSTEIIYKLFEELNVKPDIHVLPWARAYDLALKKENILIYSMARTAEREKLFHWVGSLSNDSLYFWGLKNKFPQPIDTIDQLKDSLVATTRFSNDAKYLADNDFKNIHLTVQDEQKMLMLYLNRIDLLVASEKTIQWKAKQLSLDFDHIKKIIEVPEINNNLSVALSLKTDRETVSLFQKAFQKIKQRDTLNKIKKHWDFHN